jgi:hypothetical protein
LSVTGAFTWLARPDAGSYVPYTSFNPVKSDLNSNNYSTVLFSLLFLHSSIHPGLALNLHDIEVQGIYPVSG